MARATKAVKAKNHAIIVATAAQMIKKHGVEGLNVSEAMGAAGLTHGGFYRHFTDKNHLVREAISAGFATFTQGLRDDMANYAAPEAFARFVDRYLSEMHVKNVGMGCPVAALAGEIPRQDPITIEAYNAGVSELIALLDQLLEERNLASIKQGRTVMALLSGTIANARAELDETKRSLLLLGTARLLAA